MKPPRYLFFVKSPLLFVIIAMFFLSCSGGKKIEQVTKSASSGLVCELIVRDSAFALGSKVPFSISMRNTGSDSLKIAFANTCIADLIVERDGKKIWRRTDGLSCAQMIVHSVIPPNDSIVLKGEWNSSASKGKKISLGRYSMRGVVFTIPPIETESVFFYLVD